MSAPSIKSITENPLPGNANPFDLLPRETVGEIASHLGGPSRTLFEGLCHRFHAFATDLPTATERFYNFTLTRPMTQSERNEAQMKTLRSRLAGGNVETIEREEKELQDTPLLSGEDNLALERKIELENQELLNVFKRRASEFRWEPLSEEFFNGILRYSKSYFLTPSFCMEIKTIKTIQRCSDKLCLEIVKIYGDQDLKNITLESFRERVEFLRKWGHMSHYGYVTELRLAVKRKGEPEERQSARTAEIEAVRQELVGITKDSPRWIAARELIQAKLIAERTGLDKRRLELCGPTGFDGEIDAASKAHRRVSKGEWEPLHLAYLKSKGLKDELGHIAVFDDTGRIIGGRLFDIEVEMQPDAIDRAAQTLIERQARFYEMLNGSIDESEEEAGNRETALVAILFQ